VLGDILAEEGSALAEELGESARFQLLDVTNPGRGRRSSRWRRRLFRPLTTWSTTRASSRPAFGGRCRRRGVRAGIAVNRPGFCSGCRLLPKRAMFAAGERLHHDVSSSAAMSDHTPAIIFLRGLEVGGEGEIQGRPHWKWRRAASGSLHHPGQIQTALNTGSPRRGSHSAGVASPGERRLADGLPGVGTSRPSPRGPSTCRRRRARSFWARRRCRLRPRHDLPAPRRRI